MNLQLFFYNPDLWWPNGMGKQSLYNVHITVDVKGYGESDAWSHLFGFRKIESHIDSATSGRYCFIPSRTFYIGFYFDIMICSLLNFDLQVVQGQRTAYHYPWWWLDIVRWITMSFKVMLWNKHWISCWDEF